MSQGAMEGPAVAVVLAAGKGTRMGSDRPKVLVELQGRALVHHVLDAAREAGLDEAVVVVGHRAGEVRAALSTRGDMGLRFALQPEQRGTGHALLCALPSLEDHRGPVVILSGDVPGVAARTLTELVAACRRSSAGLALLAFRPEHNTGYGRVLRDAAGRVRAIVEERDATEAQRREPLCNAGVYCVAAGVLRRHLAALADDNAAGELYLTDIVALAAEAAGEVAYLEVDAAEVQGVNTPAQLAELEARWALSRR